MCRQRPQAPLAWQARWGRMRFRCGHGRTGTPTGSGQASGWVRHRGYRRHRWRHRWDPRRSQLGPAHCSPSEACVSGGLLPPGCERPCWVAVRFRGRVPPPEILGVGNRAQCHIQRQWSCRVLKQHRRIRCIHRARRVGRGVATQHPASAAKHALEGLSRMPARGHRHVRVNNYDPVLLRRAQPQDGQSPLGRAAHRALPVREQGGIGSGWEGDSQGRREGRRIYYSTHRSDQGEGGFAARARSQLKACERRLTGRGEVGVARKVALLARVNVDPAPSLRHIAAALMDKAVVARCARIREHVRAGTPFNKLKPHAAWTSVKDEADLRLEGERRLAPHTRGEARRGAEHVHSSAFTPAGSGRGAPGATITAAEGARHRVWPRTAYGLPVPSDGRAPAVPFLGRVRPVPKQVLRAWSEAEGRGASQLGAVRPGGPPRRGSRTGIIIQHSSCKANWLSPPYRALSGRQPSLRGPRVRHATLRALTQVRTARPHSHGRTSPDSGRRHASAGGRVRPCPGWVEPASSRLGMACPRGSATRRPTLQSNEGRMEELLLEPGPALASDVLQRCSPGPSKMHGQRRCCRHAAGAACLADQ
jgi:hypothetical protein